jgi:hypothetical protein
MTRTLIALLVIALTAAPAGAIPAFARKHRMTCLTCHDPIPRLNAFGERFAEQGFMVSPDDTTGMTTLGDPLLVLSSSFPVAVRFDAYARYVSGTGGYTDFSTPWVTKLLSGGQVARGVSYYVYFLLSERGETGPIEDAWVMFTEPAGIPASFTVGQFQIADPLWKREARVTLEDYRILSWQVGAAAARLTYDRGLLVSASPSEHTALFGEIVNGNGIGEATGGRFDGDTPKTWALAGTQDIGPLTVGFLGYFGNQRFTPIGAPASITNRTRMIGPAAWWSAGSVALATQWLYRDDTDPTFTGTPGLTTTRGGFVEAMWWPRGQGSRLVLTGLYNGVDAESAPNYQTVTGNVSWLLARNLRLSGELTWDLERDRAAVGLGVVTAF